MSKNTLNNLVLTFLLSKSFFGFLLIGVLSFKAPIFQEGFSRQKEIIGVVFGLICLFGIFAALSPNSCSQIVNLRRKEKPAHRGDLGQNKVISQTFDVRGHHRMCGNFSSHVFHLRGRIFCASCTGLLIGGLLSLAGTVLYFFFNWHIGSGPLLFAFGALGVALNMLSILLFDLWIKHLVRAFLNIFFVSGAFLILVAVDEQAQNFGLNLLVIAFSVFWLLTRILLSQWRHERICSACDVENCVFRH